MSRNARDSGGRGTPSPLLICTAADGRVQIAAQLSAETLWLTQLQMAELFQTTQQNISLHLQNVYDEGELLREATHKDFLLVRQEGARQVSRKVEHYNLDAVLSVGYRVKSSVATRFRIWATQTLPLRVKLFESVQVRSHWDEAPREVVPLGGGCGAGADRQQHAH